MLTLVATDLPFRTFRNDDYEPTPIKMVVTEADTENRIVRELNAEPAAQEYARVCGILDTTLDAFSFASHPVLVSVGGEHFVRSIQRVNPDGSLSFFCAIDEGLVFTAARRLDPMESLARLFERIEGELGEVDLYLGFDCVLRRLAAEREQAAQPMSNFIASSGSSASTPTASNTPRCTSTRPSPASRSGEGGPKRRDAGAAEAEELRRQIAKLEKINAKLISRVERSYDQSPAPTRCSRPPSPWTIRFAAAPRNCSRRCGRSSRRTRTFCGRRSRRRRPISSSPPSSPRSATTSCSP